MITLGASEKHYLDLLLQPNTSLAPERFILLMCIVLFISTTVSVVLLMVGAWPAIAFVGVDVLLLYAAFRVYFNTAKHYERLQLDNESLVLCNKKGVIRSWEPTFLQVLVEEAEEGLNKPRLLLAQHGEHHEIASFLGVDEKQEIKAHLLKALRLRLERLPHTA